jgi:rubrerythrin
MASRSEETKKPTSDRPEQKKKRNCLMCGTGFESTHFGERICPACKGTAAWREGGFAA